jgi:hypothetical protein
LAFNPRHGIRNIKLERLVSQQIENPGLGKHRKRPGSQVRDEESNVPAL